MKKNRLFSLLMLIFIFVIIISDLFSVDEGSFSFGDEILCLVLLLYFVLSKLQSLKLKKNDSIMISCFILITLIGLAGNFIQGFQKNLYIIFLDILSTFKYIFIFWGLNEFFDRKDRNLIKLVNFFFFVYKIYILILFSCSVLNQFIDIGMSIEYRYGIKGFSFITHIPGIVINHCSYFLLFLLLGKKDKFNFWSAITAFVMVSTLKSRAFILVAAYVFLMYARNHKVKIKKSHIVVILLVLIAIGYPQFKSYFIVNKSVRYLFLKNSILLSNEYFPLGTGFSTYGTGTAASNYSLVYYKLGFHVLYGMGPEGNMYLCDTFFPAILGQFGYFGFIIYISMMSYFSYLIYKKSNKSSIFVAYFFIIDIWLSSIQSAYVTSSSMACLLVLTMILTRTNNNKNKVGA